MKMDIGLLYGIVAAVCAIVNAIILGRVLSTGFRETIDKAYCHLLQFFILFAAEDAIWGCLTSEIFPRHRIAYILFTYGFHAFAAVAAFMWSGYAIRYSNGRETVRRIINIIRSVLLIFQLALLFSNIWTHKFFIIDSDCIYHSFGNRTVNFALQMLYFVLLAIYGFAQMTDRKILSVTARQTMIFSIIPLAFGFGQLLWPDAPMYSLGFMVSAVCIYTITASKQQEEYFRRMLKEEQDRYALEAAEKASAAKTNFLFNMSHDIRTPMNAIIGFTNLAKKNIDDRDALNDCLNKVKLSSEHLLTLINDVLDMSRIESGKMAIEPTPQHLTANNEKLLAIVNELVQDKGQTLNFNYVNLRDEYVRYDLLHVNQLLLNILSNAVKYTPDGGTIDFTIEQLDSPDETKCLYRYTVRDNGIGMSPEFLEHVYDEFEREETVRASGIQGTGLGMSIVKRLIDMMGAKINIESEKGKGTTVTFLLSFDRCERSDVALLEKDTLPDTAFLHGKTVLLVDDNELNREIAVDILEDTGLAVETAENGKEAFGKIRDSEPGQYDFVLMDIQMPFMNGYEATRAIRALGEERFKTLPIIAMTANAFEEDKRNALEAGMNAHLTKPVSEQAIVRTLASFVK